MKLRIHCNKWGNWNGYVGARRVIEFGLDWRAAEEWLTNPAQHAADHAAALAASPVLLARPVCEWIDGENGPCRTQCGHAFEFISDGVKENGFKFCCFCGGAISVKEVAKG